MPGRSEHHLRQALALAPGERSLWVTLARLVATAGERDRALAVVAEAREKLGPDPTWDRLEVQIRRAFERR
jgi:hypothetical protein